MKRRGFTLIELMIAIAIIGIVAVIGTDVYYENQPCKRWTQETHQVCVDDNPNHIGHYCAEYATRQVNVCVER